MLPSEIRPSFDFALFAVIFVAFWLRLLPVFAWPGVNYPDEIFQTIEQAHRLVFGYGMVPWEFQLGTRSWILPGALAGLIQLSRVFGEGPGVYIPFTGVALAMLSAGAAGCGALWGRRVFGRGGMVIAGLLPAAAMDLIYFGPRTLSEVVAAHILVIGLYLATSGRDWRRLAWAGLCLGLAAMIRIQLAPAVALILAWPAAAGYRARWPALLSGTAAAVLASGGLDALTWGTAFHSTWRNFAVNMLEGAAADNGVAPWTQFGAFLLDYWGAGGVAATLLLALVGTRHVPQLFATALVILISHSAIGHKEYRFIYPAILLLELSAGLGLAQMTTWAAEALDRERPGARWIGAACWTMAAAFPVLVTLGEATRPSYQELWSRGRGTLWAAGLVARQEDVCGIGSFGMHWAYSGGYAHFHHRAPYYWPIDDDAIFRKYKPAFNILIYTRRPPSAREFADVACDAGVCVAIRKGGCASMPASPSDLPGPMITGLAN